MSKMMNIRPEVYWSPSQEDYFLNWGAVFELFHTEKIQPEDELVAPRIRIGPYTSAKIISTHKDNHIKCLAWYPGLQDDNTKHILAVGHNSGKVLLVNLAKTAFGSEFAGTEFMPRFPRPVNVLSWNNHAHHYLAVGLEKATRANSVVILDVNRGFTSYDKDLFKPVMEWCCGETIHSIGFSNQSPQTLFAGTNSKQIKVFDIRDEKLATTISTKAVHGVCFDPFNKNRFASYIDGVVHLWDMRNYENPIITLPDFNNKSVLKLSFCPTRYGWLSALSRENIAMRLYDIQKQEEVPTGVEPALVTRYSTPDSMSLMATFAWHPTHPNRVLVGSYSGSLIDFTVKERITLNWSTLNSLAWNDEDNRINFLHSNSAVLEQTNDISFIIKRRATNGYGSHIQNISKNGELTDDPALSNVWTWLEQAKRLACDPNFTVPGGGPYQYQGAIGFVKKYPIRSDVLVKAYIGVDEPKMQIRTFRCAERSMILALCGWAEDDWCLTNLLTSLQNNGEYTRAAALSIFSLNIVKAINALKLGSQIQGNSMLNVTAMALAGYSSERKGLWRETCSDLFKKIDDPHLRAAFEFLTQDSDTFDPILTNDKLNIQDRVGFACRYLSDVRLVDFLEQLNTELIQNINLEALLLTGLEGEGIELLQCYLHATSDVQTLALIAVHTLASKVDENLLLSHWIEKSLLDSMQLWKERALVDVILNQGRKNARVPQQIYISCPFCMKSISSFDQSIGRTKNSYTRMGAAATNKLKISACPNCRKPLPRCALCLQYMGTPSRRANFLTKEQYAKLESSMCAKLDYGEIHAVSEAATWFSWCQSCHHGGHSIHLSQWFKDHKECPVTACHCKCMNIDSINKQMAHTNIQ